MKSYPKPIGRIWAIQGTRMLAAQYFSADHLALLKSVYSRRFSKSNVVRART